MSTSIEVFVNSAPVEVKAGSTAAVAILVAGVDAFRLSPSGQPRGPLCGMGICAECRATIDGVANQYTCLRLCHPGMRICTEVAAAGAGARGDARESGCSE
ncbi:MAG: (2Fe-2S)-binding protein [Bryobacterales bacterium]|jgi:sarcosine oxidase subunit alpha|nr:(2Fe-2S)-binding protein [Bryobacterales bacterium]